jgi:hypothetical protein
VEVGERGQHDRIGHHARHLDAQAAAQRVGAVAQARFHFVDVGENLRAALVVSRAFGSEAQASRGAHEQLRAEQRFEVLHDGGRARAGNLERFGGLGEAVGIDDANEGAHRLNSVEHGQSPVRKRVIRTKPGVSKTAKDSANRRNIRASAGLQRAGHAVGRMAAHVWRARGTRSRKPSSIHPRAVNASGTGCVARQGPAGKM